jgi:hypothetical protein
MISRIVIISANIKIPIAVAVLNGFIMQLALGTWFFRNRGTDSAGNALGWRGGMKLMAIAYGVFVSISIVLLGFLYLLKNAKSH